MSSSSTINESGWETFARGPIRVGSEAHKQLFCRTLLDTFNPYKPAVIDAAELIDLCLSENARRMSGYDRRLLRPFAVPALAKLMRRFMRSGPKPKIHA